MAGVFISVLWHALTPLNYFMCGVRGFGLFGGACLLTFSLCPPTRLFRMGCARWQRKHYVGRGDMHVLTTGGALAAGAGVELVALEQTTDHYQAAKTTDNDPDGGSSSVCPSGKSWVKARRETWYGNVFYYAT